MIVCFGRLWQVHRRVSYAYAGDRTRRGAGSVRRIMLAILIFALLGLVTSIAIAWGATIIETPRPFGTKPTVSSSSSWSSRVHGAEDWIAEVDQSVWWCLISARCWPQTEEAAERAVAEGRAPVLHEAPAWSRLSEQDAQRGATYIELAAGWPRPAVRGSLYASDSTWLWDYETTGMLAGRDPWRSSSSNPMDVMFLPIAPITSGLVLDTLAFAAVWWAPFLLYGLNKRQHAALRRRKGLCPRCRYSLAGITSERCPECGGDRHERPAVLNRRILSTMFVIAVLLIFALAVLLIAFVRARPYPPLPYAAHQGEIDQVKRLLADGADPGQIVEFIAGSYVDVKTPLMLASQRGHADVVRVLLDAGADVNAEMGRGWTALVEACMAGEVAIIDELLARGADPAGSGARLTPTWAAAYGGHADVIDRLAAEGVDMTGQERALWMACRSEHRACIESLLDNGCVVTPLVLGSAVRQNDHGLLDLLLAHGGELTDRLPSGETVLFYLPGEADARPMWQRLIDAGIDVNARNDAGRTALFHAPSAEAARFLLDHGADPTVRDHNGHTALHHVYEDTYRVIEDAIREWEAREAQ
jgi:ankyrin repeat protein